jgi:hypothetical protein
LIILDEKSYAEELLKNGSQTPYPKLYDVIVLAKYYRFLEMETHDIRLKLEEYCHKTDKDWNKVLSGWKIVKALNTIKLYRLRTAFSVIVTKTEVETIKQWKDYNYQKVLFVLIVMAKISKYFQTRIKPFTKARLINNFYVNETIINVFKMSRISIRRNKRYVILHEFHNAGLLEFTYKNSFNIKCIDENSNPEIIVTDFENIVLYWSRYCGERVAGCGSCGKLFLQRTVMQSKCRSCYAIERKEKVRLAVMKNYHKNKDKISEQEN